MKKVVEKELTLPYIADIIVKKEREMRKAFNILAAVSFCFASEGSPVLDISNTTEVNTTTRAVAVYDSHLILSSPFEFLDVKTIADAHIIRVVNKSNKAEKLTASFKSGNGNYLPIIGIYDRPINSNETVTLKVCRFWEFPEERNRKSNVRVKFTERKDGTKVAITEEVESPKRSKKINTNLRLRD
ncbi:MAG: hypothetical protein LBL99_03770 [Holosporaceae bacterium]|nr:hypothetical protein [Holosporaceae bacterium]